MGDSVEPGSVCLHHPAGVVFSIVYGTGGFRAATFFATTRVSREALDHRLLAPTASGVVLRPVSSCPPLLPPHRFRQADPDQHAVAAGVGGGAADGVDVGGRPPVVAGPDVAGGVDAAALIASDEVAAGVVDVDMVVAS